MVRSTISLVIRVLENVVFASLVLFECMPHDLRVVWPSAYFMKIFLMVKAAMFRNCLIWFCFSTLLRSRGNVNTIGTIGQTGQNFVPSSPRLTEMS